MSDPKPSSTDTHPAAGRPIAEDDVGEAEGHSEAGEEAHLRERAPTGRSVTPVQASSTTSPSPAA